jgi:predicted nuclease with TOPRIM domain
MSSIMHNSEESDAIEQALRGRIEQLERELAQWENRASDLDNECNKLANELAALKAELAEVKANYEIYYNGWVEVSKCRNTAEKELAALKAQSEPVACQHEWFRTGAMEHGECRCIKCGVWNKVTPQPSVEDAAIVKAAIAWREDHLSDSQLCGVIDAAMKGEG